MAVTVSAIDLRALVAEDGTEEPSDDFVEDTARRLLGLLDLPVPDELAD